MAKQNAVCEICGAPCHHNTYSGSANSHLGPRCNRHNNLSLERAHALGAIKAPTSEIEPIFCDKKAAEFNAEEWLDHYEETQALKHKASGSQNKALIKLPTDHPIAICFSADWHLGGVAVDVKSFREHINFILDTPDLFMITAGDLNENFRQFKSLSPILNQCLSPAEQGKLLRCILQRMMVKKKWLAAKSGNHDERDEAIFGESPIAEMFEKEVVHFPGIGQLTLKVGAVEYSIVITHKARWHSMFNDLHSNMRVHQVIEPADIVVTAHTHRPAWAQQYRYQRLTTWIKCGTFQTDDEYSQRYFEPGIVSTPTVVLDPNEHKVFCAGNPQDAIAYMKGAA